VNISKELFARRNQGNALFEGYKHQIEELLQMISTGEDLTDLLRNFGVGGGCGSGVGDKGEPEAVGEIS
jgi:hypothetical protein